MTDFDLCEKLSNEPEINACNSYEKAQNACENHYRANQAAGRLDIEGIEDSALGKSQRSGGHAAGRAWNTVPDSEAASSEVSPHVGMRTCGYDKGAEKRGYDCENNSRNEPLPFCGTEKQF